MHVMSERPKIQHHATYEDYLAVPEGKVVELIDGVLYTQSRPASPHTITASALGGRLNVTFGDASESIDGPGGWWILSEPELQIGANVLVPDVGGWRRARGVMPPITHRETILPDWVCEVLSPGQHGRDRLLKCDKYARAGIAHYWIVDPVELTIEVLRLEQGRYIPVQSAEGNVAGRFEPFEAHELALGRLWDRGIVSPKDEPAQR